MEFALFEELLIILGLSIAVLLIGDRLRVPPVVCLLLTGVLSGPHGFGLVTDIVDVDHIAEMGIILLLFGIGMEFSFKKLVQIRRQFLLGGSLQVGLTIILGAFLGYIIGRPWREAFFLGFLLSMSSTAIVLRTLEQQGETSSPHGRLSISILIFQDLIAIPMILFTPLLSTNGDRPAFDTSSLWPVAKGLVSLVIVFFAAQRLVPRFLLLVARTRNKELFLLSVLALCFGVAWFTSHIGLSLTMGAFLTGLIISESEYSSEAISHIFPFQALFISVFFISIGMLLDTKFVLQQPLLILMLALLILFLKTFTGGISTVLLGMPIRTAVLVGAALSQIGEFSFVLAKTGVEHGLGSDYHYQLFLSVSLLTLALSPSFMFFSTKIADWISSLPFPQKFQNGYRPLAKENPHNFKDHIIILGFGLSGKNLARSSKLAGIPYVILEMNPDTVKEQKKLGEPIFFGDATHMHVLEQINIQEAKAMAVLVNDPLAAKRIVQIARKANPFLYIIVRARFVPEMELFIKLGANEVIPDEFGTSLEVFSHVLKRYYVPHDEIQKFINTIRSDGYEKLKDQNLSSQLSEMKLNLTDIKINACRIFPDSVLVGKTLFDSQLRKSYGVTVLLIRRGNQMIPNPLSDTVLEMEDIVVYFGEERSSRELKMLFGTI